MSIYPIKRGGAKAHVFRAMRTRALHSWPLACLLFAPAVVADSPKWQPPNCPYGLEPGAGPMRCADPDDPNSVAYQRGATVKPRLMTSANIDPCGLLSTSEAAAALQVGAVRQTKFGEGRVTSSGAPSPYLICDFEGGVRHLRVEITLPTFWYSVQHMGSERGVKAVSGIGEQAYIYNSAIYVRKGKNVVDVVFSGDRESPDALYTTLARLGSLVASRMPNSRGTLEP
jgi:hypothetical protein